MMSFQAKLKDNINVMLRIEIIVGDILNFLYC